MPENVETFYTKLELIDPQHKNKNNIKSNKLKARKIIITSHFINIHCNFVIINLAEAHSQLN